MNEAAAEPVSFLSRFEDRARYVLVSMTVAAIHKTPRGRKPTTPSAILEHIRAGLRRRLCRSFSDAEAGGYAAILTTIEEHLAEATQFAGDMIDLVKPVRNLKKF